MTARGNGPASKIETAVRGWAELEAVLNEAAVALVITDLYSLYHDWIPC